MIYRITCRITGEYYIGSTFDMKTRTRCHLSTSNNCVSRQIISRGEYNINILEELPRATKEELLTAENKYIIHDGFCINKNRSIVTEEERRRDVAEYKKKYYRRRKEALLNYQNEYVKSVPMIECGCGGRCRGKLSYMIKHFNSSRHKNHLLSELYSKNGVSN